MSEVDSFHAAVHKQTEKLQDEAKRVAHLKMQGDLAEKIFIRVAAEHVMRDETTFETYETIADRAWSAAEAFYKDEENYMAGARNLNPLEDNVLNIVAWGEARGLTQPEHLKAQMNKLTEEVGELASAVNRITKPGKVEEAADAIGDVFVVITLMAGQMGLRIEDCVNKAYTTIKNRDGQLINGIFVKAEESDA